MPLTSLVANRDWLIVICDSPTGYGNGMHFPAILSNYNGPFIYRLQLFYSLDNKFCHLYLVIPTFWHCRHFFLRYFGIFSIGMSI